MGDESIPSYQAKPPHELSIGVEFMPAPNVDMAMRRAAALLRPTPPTIRMSRWPNDLGESPSDAIDKFVELSWEGTSGSGVERYRIDSTDGHNLTLVPA